MHIFNGEGGEATWEVLGWLVVLIRQCSELGSTTRGIIVLDGSSGLEHTKTEQNEEEEGAIGISA